jgi:hypothetical protein
MRKTAKKCEGAKLRGDVNLFPARERAWARGTTPLMLLQELAVSGHCRYATALHGRQLSLLQMEGAYRAFSEDSGPEALSTQGQYFALHVFYEILKHIAGELSANCCRTITMTRYMWAPFPYECVAEESARLAPVGSQWYAGARAMHASMPDKACTGAQGSCLAATNEL